MVSVIVPVYNGAESIRAALESLLLQDHEDFDIIVVDDCSTDCSLDIVESIQDERISVLSNPINRGLADSLNRAIATCSSEIIIRQDQDDISHPARVGEQVKYLKEHPHVVLVGTWASIQTRDADGRWHTVGNHRHPMKDSELRWRLLWSNPFVHSSVAFRKSAFDEVGGYAITGSFSVPEDYGLWSRLAQVGCVANIGIELVTYRQSSTGMSHTMRDAIREGVKRIGSCNYARMSGERDRSAEWGRIIEYVNGFAILPLSIAQASKSFTLLCHSAFMVNKTFSPKTTWQAAVLFCRSLIRSLADSIRKIWSPRCDSEEKVK